MRAADALFGEMTKSDVSADAPAPAADQPERPAGRILRAIEPTPVIEIAPAPEPRRRGRPLGSKNKPRPDLVRPHAETHGSDDGSSAEDLVASLFGSADENDTSVPAPIVAPVTRVMRIEPGPRLRLAWLKRELQPGERWKRRLSPLCW